MLLSTWLTYMQDMGSKECNIGVMIDDEDTYLF